MLDDQPPFGQDGFDCYQGKYILVGVTYMDRSGEVRAQQQLHGIIESVSLTEGFHIALRGLRAGEVWTMPPAFEVIEQARPGTYTLRSTGETIENPDLLATWEVYPDQSE